MKIVSAEEMRAIDRATSEHFGVASLTLMENAGGAVTDFVLAHHAAAGRIVVFCGKGNNGGDGFVAARRLHERGKKVQVILLAAPGDLRGGGCHVWQAAECPAIAVQSGEELKSEWVRPSLQADLYLDAVLGTGFKPPVSGLYAEAIAGMNASQIPVIAVDIPSGADADAMGEEKLGRLLGLMRLLLLLRHVRRMCSVCLQQGPTVVAGIGSPEEAIVSALRLNVITARDVGSLIGPRPAESNKGNYGHVLMVGGSLGKAGAAAMAGMAVLRTGGGLSTIATARSVLGTVAGFHPELMTEPFTRDGCGHDFNCCSGSNRGIGKREDCACDWAGDFAGSADCGAGAESSYASSASPGFGRRRTECF